MPKEGEERSLWSLASVQRADTVQGQLEGRFGGDQANQAPDQWQLGESGRNRWDKTGVPAQERLDGEQSEFCPFSLFIHRTQLLWF